VVAHPPFRASNEKDETPTVARDHRPVQSRFMSESLVTPRLLLRPFLHSDAPRLAELAGDRAIADTMISIPHPFPQGLAAEWIAQRNRPTTSQITFAICQRNDRSLVGSISTVAIDQEHAIGELSFWVGRPYWGLGIASEAGAAMVKQAFQTIMLNRLQAYYMVRNPASARVLEHLGFRPEGLLRQRVRKWDVFEDVMICGLVRTDWLAQKA